MISNSHMWSVRLLTVAGVLGLVILQPGRAATEESREGANPRFGFGLTGLAGTGFGFDADPSGPTGEGPFGHRPFGFAWGARARAVVIVGEKWREDVIGLHVSYLRSSHRLDLKGADGRDELVKRTQLPTFGLRFEHHVMSRVVLAASAGYVFGTETQQRRGPTVDVRRTQKIRGANLGFELLGVAGRIPGVTLHYGLVLQYGLLQHRYDSGAGKARNVSTYVSPALTLGIGYPL